MVAVALGVTVYWLMRQQLEKAAEQSSALQEKLTAVEQQLVSAEKDLQLERQQAQELKMELSPVIFAYWTTYFPFSSIRSICQYFSLLNKMRTPERCCR